jgi:hypothetical protein
LLNRSLTPLPIAALAGMDALAFIAGFRKYSISNRQPTF